MRRLEVPNKAASWAPSKREHNSSELISPALWSGLQAPVCCTGCMPQFLPQGGRRKDPSLAVGCSVPILMPHYVSVLGLPGPASGWPGLGVQPSPAAHAEAHLPGRGPLLHQQAQAGRVVGTLETGGEPGAAPWGGSSVGPHNLSPHPTAFPPFLEAPLSYWSTNSS